MSETPGDGAYVTTYSFGGEWVDVPTVYIDNKDEGESNV
jgi:hypothetical protein